MSKLRLTCLAFIALLIVSSCFETHRWTDKERNDFKIKCGNTDTFHTTVLLKGFDKKGGPDSIWVREYKGKQLLDSFILKVDKGGYEEFYMRNDRPMNIHYTYHFLIPGQKPSIMSDMEMVMWPQFTNNGEGYGCVMGNFTLDSLRYTNVGNPVIWKR